MKYIKLLCLIFFLQSCNGHTYNQYYKYYINKKLSTSLEDEYREKYLKEKNFIDFRKEKDEFIEPNKYYEKQINNWNLEYKNRISKTYCVYSLSYFFPINFWNVRFTDEQYIEKAIKDMNKEQLKINAMKNININYHGLGTPLFSYYCAEINGEIFNSYDKSK